MTLYVDPRAIVHPTAKLADGVNIGPFAIIGEEVTVGHNVIVHGATVHDGALVGMGSILLDNSVIGSQAIIGAGTIVPPRMVVPADSMVRGQPGRVIRELSEHERLEGRRGALHYLELAAEHAKLSGK